MSYYAIRGSKGVLYAIVDNKTLLLNIMNQSKDSVYAEYERIEDAISWLNSMDDERLEWVNNHIRPELESKSNQQKKKTVPKDFKNDYCKEINALITMLWRDYRHTPQLHHMKQKWELWIFYYNCLKKAKGIDTYEIKKRNENKSILKNMTFNELETSYEYAVKFKDWIAQ